MICSFRMHKIPFFNSSGYQKIKDRYANTKRFIFTSTSLRVKHRLFTLIGVSGMTGKRIVDL